MKQMQLVTKAISFIESQLTNDIHLDEVAEAVGYSPYHFHRIFSVGHAQYRFGLYTGTETNMCRLRIISFE